MPCPVAATRFTMPAMLAMRCRVLASTDRQPRRRKSVLRSSGSTQVSGSKSSIKKPPGIECLGAFEVVRVDRGGVLLLLAVLIILAIVIFTEFW